MNILKALWYAINFDAPALHFQARRLYLNAWAAKRMGCEWMYNALIKKSEEINTQAEAGPWAKWG